MGVNGNGVNLAPAGTAIGRPADTGVLASARELNGELWRRTKQKTRNEQQNHIERWRGR
jgi:hypothetical protein